MATIREHFPRPLQEVSAQMGLTRKIPLELRFESFYNKIKDQFPNIHALPYLFVPPPTPVPSEQLYAPLYRFHDKEQHYLVQVGVHLLAINAVAWDRGYEGFRSVIESVTNAWHEFNREVLVDGYSLGFYNKIAVGDIDDVAWLLNEPLPLDRGSRFANFTMQKTKSIECGVLATSYSTVEDATTSERHILVNNVINSEREAGTLDIHEWLRWIDQAHKVAKAQFWKSLSGHAQEAWDRTHAAKSTS